MKHALIAKSVISELSLNILLMNDYSVIISFISTGSRVLEQISLKFFYEALILGKETNSVVKRTTY